jgi:creatinine amidohydrolase
MLSHKATDRRYENLFGEELQERIAREPLAWVPLGILERHGEHLPYGLDGLKAHGVCLWLAGQLGGVVLPATHLAGVHEPWYGDDEERYRLKRREVGDFYLRTETFRLVLEDTVAGLANLGFQNIVLYSGHYPALQLEVMKGVEAWAAENNVARVIAFAEPMSGKGDHAGRAETSLFLALGGEVRLDRVRPEQAGQIGFYSAKRPGPLEASEEFGRELLAGILAHFRQQLKPQ